MDEPQREPREPDARDLLGDWRAAERDTVAAREAARVATLALESARAAAEAAADTEAAAAAVAEAVARAKHAADRAHRAANVAADAARMLSSTAEGERVRATQHVDAAETAETSARERYHDAEDRLRERQGDRRPRKGPGG